MSNFKIGLAQMSPKLGDLSGNLKIHLHLMEQAAEQGADILVFPELSLTGYFLRDLVAEMATPLQSETLKTICDASQRLNLDVVVGFVDRTPHHNFHIAAAYISRGKIVHIHHKVYLPTYTMFDDGRFFAAGNHIQAFDTRFGRIGILICEDFWHTSSPYLLWLDGAELMLMQSASPGRGLSDNGLDVQRSVNRFLQTYASLYSSYIVHCNRVGFEDGKIFWGGSTITSPIGEFLSEAPTFDEALIVQSIDIGQLRRTRLQTNLLRDERPSILMQEISRILNIPQNNLP